MKVLKHGIPLEYEDSLAEELIKQYPLVYQKAEFEKDSIRVTGGELEIASEPVIELGEGPSEGEPVSAEEVKVSVKPKNKRK
jgi:hypothetical protein